MGSAKKTGRTPMRRAGDHPMRRKEDLQPAKGVGALIEGLLLKGKANAEVLEKVHAAFPAAKTTGASVSWYRSKLNREGRLK